LKPFCRRAVHYNLNDRLHVALAPRVQGADCDLKFANRFTAPFARTSVSRRTRAVPLLDVTRRIERAVRGTDNFQRIKPWPFQA
jgi:hypothetical protein